MRAPQRLPKVALTPALTRRAVRPLLTPRAVQDPRSLPTVPLGLMRLRACATATGIPGVSVVLVPAAKVRDTVMPAGRVQFWARAPLKVRARSPLSVKLSVFPVMNSSPAKGAMTSLFASSSVQVA